MCGCFHSLDNFTLLCAILLHLNCSVRSPHDLRSFLLSNESWTNLSTKWTTRAVLATFGHELDSKRRWNPGTTIRRLAVQNVRPQNWPWKTKWLQGWPNFLQINPNVSISNHCHVALETAWRVTLPFNQHSFAMIGQSARQSYGRELGEWLRTLFSSPLEGPGAFWEAVQILGKLNDKYVQ